MHHNTHRICSKIFAGDGRGRVLLQLRSKRPNLGLWTCVGGKLHGEDGESPLGCALRELREETGLVASEGELELFGLVSENNYEGGDNWLMFLFRLTRPVAALPAAACEEGRHQFHALADLPALPLPPVDRDCLWPLYLERRPGLTMIRIDCHGGNEGEVFLEQGPALPTLAEALRRAGLTVAATPTFTHTSASVPVTASPPACASDAGLGARADSALRAHTPCPQGDRPR